LNNEIVNWVIMLSKSRNMISF